MTHFGTGSASLVRKMCNKCAVLFTADTRLNITTYRQLRNVTEKYNVTCLRGTRLEAIQGISLSMMAHTKHYARGNPHTTCHMVHHTMLA